MNGAKGQGFSIFNFISLVFLLSDQKMIASKK